MNTMIMKPQVIQTKRIGEMKTTIVVAKEEATVAVEEEDLVPGPGRK
jgi:hypothetical protein